MSTARTLNHISIEDYLEGELSSSTKHEYLGGRVYAMVGARNSHKVIASNVLVAFGSQLRGKPCRAFNSDTKIRISFPDHVRFYYPDVSVVCEQNPLTDTFQDQPVVIVEVLSEGTQRLDDGEKRDAYLTLPSLRYYILLEQETAAAVIYEPGEGASTRTVYTSLDDVIELAAIDAKLSLRDAYEGVLSRPND